MPRRMSLREKTENALEELIELKKQKKEIDESIQRVQNWIFAHGEIINEYQSEDGTKLVRVSQTKYDIEDNNQIIRRLRSAGYNEAEMLAMAKFQVGELRRRVGDDRIRRWVGNGLRQINSEYYKINNSNS